MVPPVYRLRLVSIFIFPDDQLKSVAEGLRECLKFVEINAEAVRKILDKAESHLLAPSESVKAASKPADSTQKQKTKTTRRLDSRTRKLISQNEFLISRLRPDRPTASRLESLRVYSGLDCVVEEIRHVTPAFAIDLVRKLLTLCLRFVVIYRGSIYSVLLKLSGTVKEL